MSYSTLLKNVMKTKLLQLLDEDELQLDDLDDEYEMLNDVEHELDEQTVGIVELEVEVHKELEEKIELEKDEEKDELDDVLEEHVDKQLELQYEVEGYDVLDDEEEESLFDVDED